MPANRSGASQRSTEQRLADLLQQQRARWVDDAGKLLAIKQAALETKRQFDNTLAEAVDLQNQQRAEPQPRRRARLSRDIVARLVVAVRLKATYQQCLTDGARCRRRLVRRLARMRPLQRALDLARLNR